METLTKTNKLGSIQDFKGGNFEDKKFIFHLCKANISDSYSDKKTKAVARNFPTSVSLKLEQQVSVKGKGMKIARYVPGELSIWKEEQTADDKIPKVAQYLEFIDGRKHIDGTDKQLLEFLMVTDWNESKEGRDTKVNPIFKMLDLGVGLEKEIEKEILAYDVILWCLKGKYDEVAAYARVLGVSIQDDESQVRSTMKRKAMANPSLFKAGMNNELTQHKHFILEAIDAGVLMVDKDLNTLSWDNGRLVITAPRGHDIIDFFVDHSVSENGKAQYEILLEKIGKAAKKEVKIEEPILSTTGLTIEQATDLFDECVQKEVIVKVGKAIWVFDTEGRDEKKFVGSAKVIIALREDSAFLKNVNTKLKK